MANLTEATTYDAGVYQIETTDPVTGGPAGIANKGAINLANRTKYLKSRVDLLEAGTTVPTGIATLASPLFTGDPRGPTTTNGDADTTLATTAFVKSVVGGRLSKNIAGGVNVTLTADECGSQTIVLTGAVTASIAVIFATTPTREWTVINATTGNFLVTLRTASGSGVVTAGGTTAIIASDGTNIVSVVPASALLQTQIAGNRNLIINGNCEIQQRGTSGVVVSGTGPSVRFDGPQDMFPCGAFNTPGGSFTQSTSSILFNGRKKTGVRQTVNSPAANLTSDKYWSGILQNIESINCIQIYKTPAVISFVFNTNVSGTYSVAFRLIGSSDATNTSFVSIFTAVANVPSKVEVFVPVAPDSAFYSQTGSATDLFDNALGAQVCVGFLNTGIYSTSQLNTWIEYSSKVTSSISTNWSSTVGNFIELTDLQLEAGTVATPFEHRNIAVEYSMCKRYFERVSAHSYFYASLAYQGSSVTFGFQEKRSIPSVSWSSWDLLNTQSITPDVNVSGGLYYVVSVGAGYCRANSWIDLNAGL